MKHFTLFTLALVFWAVNGMAQFDLQVNTVATIATSGGQVPPGTPITLTMEIENTGADWPVGTVIVCGAILPTDTVGVVQYTVGPSPFAAGGSTIIETGSFQLPAAPPSVTLCAIAVLALPENDTTNNVACNVFTVSSSAQFDMAALFVASTNPAMEDLDSFDIDGGDETPPAIVDLTAIYRNDGNTIIPAGYGIAYQLSVDGNTQNITGTLAEDLAPGDSTTRTIQGQNFAVPAEEGFYEICAILLTGDDDASNDTTCTGFSIIDTYIPPPPIGISEDVETAGLDVFFSNQKVWVKNVTTATDVKITDMQGRVVEHINMLEDGSISMQNAVPGVYLVQTTEQSMGAVKLTKFVVN